MERALSTALNNTSDTHLKRTRRLSNLKWTLVALLALFVWLGSIVAMKKIVGSMYWYFRQPDMVTSYFTSESFDAADVLAPRIRRPLVLMSKNPRTLMWLVKQTPDGEYVEYVWELVAVSPELPGLLRERGIPTDDWWREEAAEYGPPSTVEPLAIMIPANEAALEVHKELGLPLPEGFSLEMMAGD